MAYPGGDVPSDKGVCSDVVIRSYRQLGIDLQVKIHEDMKKNFALYPKIWGLNKTDRNIDHRRVPNLITFFKRHGKILPKNEIASNYQPGDLVTWKIDNRLPHIGIVSSQKSTQSGHYLIIHNIGSGPQAEDCLFDWPLTGHFRYQ